MCSATKRGEIAVIPKVIHYCWFGGNPKPEIVEKCLESWRKHCPDWEIIEWNEQNFEVRGNVFMSEAYDAGRWAFVSDVARLMIVYEHGGIYLDADVELLASLEQLLQYDTVFAYDNLVSIATGLGFGSVPGHPFIREMLECYADMHFDPKHIIACPVLNTAALKKCCPGLVLNGEQTQCIDNNIFYSVSDFSVIGRHHGMQSWVNGPKYNHNRKRTKIGRRVQKWLQRPEKFAFIEAHFPPCIQKCYLYLSYDFFDCGILYFVKRVLYRLFPKK